MDSSIWKMIDKDCSDGLEEMLSVDPAIANKPGGSGNLPLHMAVKLDRHRSAEALLRFGVNPNEATTIVSKVSGRTDSKVYPVMLARSPEMLRRLVSHGASLDVLDGNGRTVLARLSRARNCFLLDCYVELGGKTELKDMKGILEILSMELGDQIRTDVEARPDVFSYVDAASQLFRWLTLRIDLLSRI